MTIYERENKEGKLGSDSKPLRSNEGEASACPPTAVTFAMGLRSGNLDRLCTSSALLPRSLGSVQLSSVDG